MFGNVMGAGVGSEKMHELFVLHGSSSFQMLRLKVASDLDCE